MHNSSISPANEKVLDLVHDLGDCADSRGVLIAATTRYAELFGDYAVYGLLLSDAHMHRWQILPLENPSGTSYGGLKAEDLPEKMDSDTMAQQLGQDVTPFLSWQHVLREEVDEPDRVFASHAEEGDSRLHSDLQSVLPVAVRTVLVATWRRPSGGRGAVLLGFRESFDETEMLPLLKLAAKLTSRLAFYPGFANLVERLEHVSHSLRQNIVHDLKTPVAVIKGYAETLMMPEMGANEELRHEMLVAIAEHAERLLEDLRDILHPLDTHWEPQKEPFDLSLLVQKAVTSEKHTARASEHKFDLIGTEGELIINADKRKIRRVIENLLSNAVKYSPSPGSRVAVSVELDEEEARVTFKDEGIGMTAEQLERVLTRGGRVVDAALGIEGSGFGLDSCRRVLEAHGGTLIASSTPGHGSRFTAVLPLV